MTSPQWIRPSVNEYERLQERLSAALKSLAAAEAKLADEVRHADELAAHLTTALTICSDDLGYEWTHCGDDEPSRALLAAHAARRAGKAAVEREERAK